MTDVAVPRAVRRPLRPALMIAAAVLAVIAGWAVVPHLFTSYDPIATAPAERLQAPSTEHWLGTDHVGRDVYARIVYGTRLSLVGALVAVAFSFVVGTVVGLVAGYFGGRTDDVLMRVVDVLLSVPGLLVSLMVVTALGFGTVNVAIAVGVAGVAGFARIMRSQVMVVRQEPFVEAALVSGARPGAVLVRHIFPNSYVPVVALIALELGAAVLAIAALSFLGYGAPPPTPEWGAIVANGRDYIVVAWWLTTFPSAAIAVTVIAINMVSRSINGGRRMKRR